MPVDITRLTEGWLELESDPGLFMLLLEDFGVKNVHVEEIYDITKPFDGPVYGFIFLFRWIEERRSRRKVVDQNDMFLKEEDVVNNIFFAQQMVPNSCATHALVSVLLNCPKIELGETLTRLKVLTSGMTPENKGWAIGNTPELARAHNSHAMPQAKRCVDKNTSGMTSSRYTGEAFHFVSYVPIQGRLFELDGLKPFPIDHGPSEEGEDWTEKFRRVMTERLGVATGVPCHDIRFNLMALIPDRRIALSHKLNMLKTNREIVVTALQQLVKLNSESDKNSIKDENGSEDKIIETPVLTENEAAMIKELKLRKSDDEEISEDAKLDTISIPHLVTQDVTMCGELTLGSNQMDAISNIKSNLASSSKENIAPLTKPEKKSNLSVNTTDYSTPLTIQTSPAPSTSSTDTSSEVGSAFNSPLGWGWNSCQNSPTSSKDFRKFVVIRVAGDDKIDSPTGRHIGVPTKRPTLDTSSVSAKRSNIDMKAWSKTSGLTLPDFTKDTSLPLDTSNIPPSENSETMTTLLSKYPVLREPHTFAPKDLLALLKNVETEIMNCEASLKDENDKHTKYKIDDCRRTHNYDEFICTFLSMLAEQGKLADLVEQHLVLHKRPGIPTARIGRPMKKSDNRNVKRRRGRGKHRRRN